MVWACTASDVVLCVRPEVGYSFWSLCAESVFVFNFL